MRVRWDPAGSPTIFTAALDGRVLLWDARSGEAEASWSGHKGEILDMTISKYVNNSAFQDLVLLIYLPKIYDY